MAINLAVKYSDKIATIFTRGSYIKGKTSGEYDFTGTRTLKVYTPTTVAESDYKRSGVNRYGSPTEMQDTVQEMTMTQDKSFTLTIDKGNNLDQMNVKQAGRMLKLQMDERSAPTADKYAFAKFARDAGKVMTVTAKPTKATIVETIMDATQHLDDNHVPQSGRTIFITNEMFKFIKLSPEYMSNEELSKKAIAKGEVGEINGLSVVKVPTGYLPENCYFMITYKGSILFPYKISDAKTHKDPPGISGDLLEGRHYYDAFVIGSKSCGVCICVLGGSKAAAPTIAITQNSGTVTSEAGGKIHYTTDDSDPRYSDSKEVYTAPVVLTAGQMMRAVCYVEGKFTSDVTEKKNG